MPEILTAKAVRERRAQAAQAMGAMVEKAEAEDRPFSDDEQAQFDKLDAEYKALTRRLEAAERADRVREEQEVVVDARRTRDLPAPKDFDGAPEVTEGARTLALQSWFAYRVPGALTDEHREACRLVGLNPAADQIALRLYSTSEHRDFRAAQLGGGRAPEFRADLSRYGSGAAGGYAVAPEILRRSLEKNLLWFGGMRQVSDSIRTASGERISWPTADDTSNTGALLGESADIGSSVDPSFAKVFWDAYKFSSKPVLVPFELLQDSAFNLAEVLGAMLGERLGRITNTKFTTGTGASEPRGIVTASSAGKTTAVATAITLDEVLDLVHSIDPAYRAQGCQFMMHDNIWLYLKKLKDGNSRYLLPNHDTGVTGMDPDLQLWGYPVVINNDMQSSVATATKTMVFGQLSRYKIRTVGEVRLYRLQERYRHVDQDAFLALMREDGNLLDAGTDPVKHLLQA